MMKRRIRCADGAACCAMRAWIRTGWPSPGRLVSGEMPDLAKRQMAQKNGDAPGGVECEW